MVNVLIPAVPESSNVLLFELILLQSSEIPKDYVVGWGVFPVVNSEFQVNEGKFKCPLLFGNVNRKFDKFSRLEELLVKDLDNWLCNLYFEVEKVNLMDLLIDKNTDQLFFAPLHLLKTKEQEIRMQKLKRLRNELTGGQTVAGAGFDTSSRKSKRSQRSYRSAKTSEALSSREDRSEEQDDGSSYDVNAGHSSSEEEYMQSDEDGDEEAGRNNASAFYNEMSKFQNNKDGVVRAEKAWEDELDVNMERTQEDIDFDQYKYAVGMKYDLKSKDLSKKKIKYIMDEVLMDFKWEKRYTLDFQLGWFQVFFLFYFR